MERLVTSILLRSCPVTIRKTRTTPTRATTIHLVAKWCPAVEVVEVVKVKVEAGEAEEVESKDSEGWTG